MSTDRVLRLVVASTQLPDLQARAARSVVNGVWLGALSDDRLRDLDEHYYDGEQVYRTAEWNRRGLFGWERAAVEQHFAGLRRIAVAACGGGREVLALREAGFEAIGYEPHPALLAFADGFLTAEGHPSCVHPAPRDSFPPGERCDGAVVGWGAYSLIHGTARRVAFLRGARERLAGDGPVLLSYFERPHHGRELRLTRRLANGLRAVAGREPVELGDTLAPNRVHIFTREQLTAEAADAGFEVRDHAIVGQPQDNTFYARAVLRPG